MTRRERKEKKIKKRIKWADKRDKKFEETMKQSQKLGEGIPLGQPILIGHHSEKRHRNHIKKMQNKASQAIEHSNMAKHHRKKAEGLQRQLDNTIFSDDPDAVERLREKIKFLEAKKNRMKEVNKALRKGNTDILTDEEKKHLEGNKRFCGSYCYQSFELTNLGANIRRYKKRLEKLSKEK